MHWEIQQAIDGLQKAIRENAPAETTAFELRISEFGTEVSFQSHSRESLERDNCPKRNLAGNWIYAPQAN